MGTLMRGEWRCKKRVCPGLEPDLSPSMRLPKLKPWGTKGKCNDGNNCKGRIWRPSLLRMTELGWYERARTSGAEARFVQGFGCHG